MPKLLIKLKKIKTQAKIKKPNFYEVILLNDDFTTMEFVVRVLQLFFDMTKVTANKIMLKDRKSTRLNSSHIPLSRMPSSA